ncbi:MAG: hemerythrin domain-containing protein [Candidatus Binatus sp.]|uniref:hemerythrin domain-containing protein n=1 Tax=Candidatus Binatus sp. TaxID=2811406 RepID=UPI003BAE98AC
MNLNTDLGNIGLSPRVLLLSSDVELTHFVCQAVKAPWKLVRPTIDHHIDREAFAQPNVRLVVLDDQKIEEHDRGQVLAQIRKHFSGISLLYIAGSHSDENEKRARANGAHYYVSKPFSLEQFGQVLRSFLRMQQVDGTSTSSVIRKSGMNARVSSAADPVVLDGIPSLSVELNREDSELRSHLLDAALAGLRLARNPELPELRHDAARIWSAIEPILFHHLDAEDKQLLPWLEQQGGLSPGAARKVRAYHERLRSLVGAMANADADRLTEVQAREVGRALSGIAVSLDDAIDDEERRLFPTIRKALFGIDHRI